MADNTSNSIVNLGDLSKPIDTLIVKLSNAIGVLYEPSRVRRIAKAEADAKIIAYEGELKLSELQKRAAHRLVTQEEMRQRNIEDVIDQAIPLISDSARPDEIGDDWIRYFFREAQEFSDERMKILWSKILAGEVNKPGSFSRRTLNFLSLMSSRDAEHFKIICKYVCSVDGKFNPAIYGFENPIYAKSGLNFDVITNLNSIGLINFEPSTGVIVKFTRPSIKFSYGEKGFILSSKYNMPSGILTIDVGQAVFTDIGRELSYVAGLDYDNEFSEFLTVFFKSRYSVK